MNIFQFVFFSIIFKCLLVSFYSDQPFSSVVFSPKGAQVISIFFSSDDSFDDMTHQLTIWQFERWYIAYMYIYILYVLLWRRQNPDLSDLAIEMLWCTACLKHCQAAMTIERLWKAVFFNVTEDMRGMVDIPTFNGWAMLLGTCTPAGCR